MISTIFKITISKQMIYRKNKRNNVIIDEEGKRVNTNIPAEVIAYMENNIDKIAPCLNEAHLARFRIVRERHY